MPRPLQCDRLLCGAVLALMFFGLIMVFSTTTGAANTSFWLIGKQCLAAAIGLTAMRALMFLDYRGWRRPKLVVLALAVAVILLVAALLSAKTANTNRFLHLGAFSLQPSELAKLSSILFLAFYLERNKKRLDDWRALGGAALIVACLCGLILAGRDLGTAVSLLIVAAVVFWVSGVKIRYFPLAALSVGLLMGLAVLDEPYRWERIISFLNPGRDPLGSGYQIQQSEIAVGTGGFFGLGLMNSRQKMDFLPAAHTDFIFAVICEELGLIGASLVVLGFGIILWRGVVTAARAPDPFGCYLACGITAMIVCQALINLGVVLALLPTKGMPLPLISYGGTAMVTTLAASGVLLSVSRRAG